MVDAENTAHLRRTGRRVLRLVVVLVAVIEIVAGVVGWAAWQHTRSRWDENGLISRRLWQQYPLVGPTPFETAYVTVRWANGELGTCSGLPVRGTDRVVTARHCVEHKQGGAISAVQVEMGSNTWTVERVLWPETGEDIALLETVAGTAGSVGKKSIFELDDGRTPIAAGDHVFAAGWNTARNAERFAARCDLRGSDLEIGAERITMVCGLGPGSSGGPVIHQTRIVAVISKVGFNLTNTTTRTAALVRAEAEHRMHQLVLGD